MNCYDFKNRKCTIFFLVYFSRKKYGWMDANFILMVMLLHSLKIGALAVD